MYQTEAMIYLHANRLYHVLPFGTSGNWGKAEKQVEKISSFWKTNLKNQLILVCSVMVVLFTIISDSTFCYHSDIILGMMIVFFAIIEADFTGIIRTVSREIPFS